LDDYVTCKGLLTIATIIFVGQIAMVELPGLQKFFNVCSLSLKDWVIIIAASSLVMWVREGYHLLKTRKIISPSHVDKTR
ncbi:MAG: cation transporting ATPase C-terminal domain-containing protein, partial [Bacteroidaceae bacterium]